MNVSRKTAERYFNDGLYEDAVFILELVFFEEVREYGPYSARTLDTRTRISEMYLAQENYVKSLTILLEVYRRKLKRLALNHPSCICTRNRVKSLLLHYGSLDVMSQVMHAIEKTFRFLMKMTKKKYQSGLHEQAFIEGSYILDDMVEFFGDANPFTLDMRCLLAVIYSANEEYVVPLQIINAVFERQIRVLGAMDRRVANTLMAEASIYLKMANFEEAMKSYCKAYRIIQPALGTHHRKTLMCVRRMAEIYYAVGNYKKALSILTLVAISQKLQNHKGLKLTNLHIAILEYARGNYEDALSVFRRYISITRRTPKRTRAMIQSTKGATLAKLGRLSEARPILKNACDIMKQTNLHAETLSAYRNYAVLLAKEGNMVLAEITLIMVLANAAIVLNPHHSVVFSIENDLAELWLSTGRFNDALRVFMKIWRLETYKSGEYHPATLRAKCQVAKVYTEQGEYNEALRMYNEVLRVMKAHFYSQHLDCLDVQNRIAFIYLCRCSFASAFNVYYNIYTILKDNYKDDHPFLIEIRERLEYLSNRVPTRGVIDAAINENMDDLVNLIHNQEDVNVRDINGCVALHHLSRSGSAEAIRILTYLLNKGAIYDVKDMNGLTPEDVAENYETREPFLLVRDLFEGIQTGQLEMIRRILERESLIINARDSAGRTPLMRAVARGNYEIVKELLSHGADLSLGSEDDGNVLHIAAENEHSVILALLLWSMQLTYGESFRTYLNCTNNVLGRTPLHCAAKNNRQESVQALIYHFADPHIEDVLGQRAYDLGPPEMQLYLMDYGFRFYSVVRRHTVSDYTMFEPHFHR